MVGADRFGDPKIPLFTIDNDQGQRILEVIDAKNAKVEILDTYVQKETNKIMPKTIHYTFTKGDIKADFTIKHPKEINTINIYGMAPKAAQEQFDQANMQPTYTRYLADTELKITQDDHAEVINGSMLYELNFPAKRI